MRYHLSIVTALAAALALGGCANLTSPARMHTLATNHSYWFDYDASRRGALVISRSAADPALQTCAEPSPDVALAFTSKLVGEAKVTPPAGAGPEVAAKLDADFRSSVVELAKRTQTIMFVREAMFRLCEQALNGYLPHDQIPGLYKLIIETGAHLAEAEVAQAKARQAEAEAIKDPEARKFLEERLKK
jgi:hypothetical protein